MTSPLAAVGAYAKLSRLVAPEAGGLNKVVGGADPATPNFASLLKEAVSSVVEAGHKSDAQAQALAAGKANMVDVVTAVAETEVAIDALVSVRDRVIQSYEEILRMQI
jgi:flagellar hook-basal body complex protein FliE